jgi:hypothetical protein
MSGRLTTKKMVELLKHRTCVGSARRAILDELETRYPQKFADHWAFVRFAEEQKLGLDFITRPKRPVLLHGGKGKLSGGVLGPDNGGVGWAPLGSGTEA